MPPRCIHPALPFLLKKWIIWRGENALNMALSYLIMLYTPMTAMEINHSRNIGANMNPTLAVPNRCMLKRITKMTSEIIVTTSAKVAKTECHSYIQSSFELWRCKSKTQRKTGEPHQQPQIQKATSKREKKEKE
jgi:hypothetical protein